MRYLDFMNSIIKNVLNLVSKIVSKIYLNNNARAAHNFPGFASVVNFTKSCPLAQLFIVVNFYKGYLMLVTQRLNELFVHGFIAVLCQYAEHGLSPKIKHSFCKLNTEHCSDDSKVFNNSIGAERHHSAWCLYLGSTQ